MGEQFKTQRNTAQRGFFDLGRMRAIYHPDIGPAIISGLQVTTIKDITDLLIYFGRATLFLDYLP